MFRKANPPTEFSRVIPFSMASCRLQPQLFSFQLLGDLLLAQLQITQGHGKNTCTCWILPLFDEIMHNRKPNSESVEPKKDFLTCACGQTDTHTHNPGP